MFKKKQEAIPLYSTLAGGSVMLLGCFEAGELGDFWKVVSWMLLSTKYSFGISKSLIPGTFQTLQQQRPVVIIVLNDYMTMERASPL